MNRARHLLAVFVRAIPATRSIWRSDATHLLLLLAIVSGLFGAKPLFAQSDSYLHRIVPVNVVLPDGRIRTALQADNFSASSHGAMVRVVSVTPAFTPGRVIIVLDASAGMIGSPSIWRLYLAATQYLLTDLPDRTLVGLVVLSSTVNSVVPLTSDRQKIRDRLASLESGSGIRGARTALFDSVRTAADSFGVAEEGDVIYAVTDGGNNLSKSKLGDIEFDLL